MPTQTLPSLNIWVQNTHNHKTTNQNAVSNKSSILIGRFWSLSTKLILKCFLTWDGWSFLGIYNFISLKCNLFLPQYSWKMLTWHYTTIIHSLTTWIKFHDILIHLYKEMYIKKTINSCPKSARYARRQHSYNICKDFLSHNSWMKNQ
jgi:hypothetical protein